MSNVGKAWLFTSIVLAALCAGCGGKSTSDLVESAKAHVAKSDHAAAIIDLKSALQQAPNLPEARFLLGVSLLAMGEPAGARLELSKAEELKYSEDALAPKMARALLASGKGKEVIQRYAGVNLQSSTANAELRTAVAVAHAQLNQRKETLAAIAEALKADPKLPWALLTQARIAASDGKLDEALALTDQAVVAGTPSGEAHLLRGVLLRHGKKDLEGAIKAFNLAVADPATVLQSRTMLVQVYLAQGKVNEAQAQVAELAKSHPKSPQALYVEAIVAYAAKDYVKAESLAEGLLRLAPGSSQLLVLGGAANLHRGNLLAAETKLGKAVQTVERMAVARSLLAETYLRMGQPEKTLATLRPLLEQAQPDSGAMALAGEAHLQAGNSQAAETLFAAAARLRPNDVQVRTALALTDLAKGNADAAFDALQALAAKDSGETADLALVSAHLRRREFDLALAAIERLEKKSTGKPTAAQLRGAALQGKGDRAGARAAYEGALKIQPDLFLAVAALASMDLQEGKPDLARTRLEAAVQANPKNGMARMTLLNFLAQQGVKPATLMAVIDEAIKMVPTDPAPRVAKITQLARQNDVKGAAAAALDAMAAMPQSAEVLDAAGRALSNSGDEQQAISAFNKLAAANPRSALPHLRLADVHAKRGDAAAVSASLARAFEVMPDSAEVHQRMLAEAARTKSYKQVLTAAKDLQTRFPQSAVGYLLEGDAESARKSWGPALAAYRGALKKSDPAGRSPKMIYVASKASGDLAGAERFATEWLRANPKEVGLRDFLGGEALLRKDYGLAERYYREVLASRPQHTAALNNLAWLMSERGDKGAVAMAERALAIEPNAPPVLDTLAQALAREGQVARAVEMQQRAVAAMPDRHEYRWKLANLLIKSGKSADAVRELEILAKLGKGYPREAEVAALLQQTRK